MPSILIYAIVAVIVRKSARVAAGLCLAHKRKRMRGLLVGWGLFLSGLLSAFYGASNGSPLSMLAGILLL